MKALDDILVQEGEVLRREFEKASTLGEGTSQEVAEFRENAFRAFVGRFYPRPYHVVKAKIRDSFTDHPSASIDCLVLNPDHPHLIDSHGKFQLVLADGVDIAIEVKPDITQKAELFRGLEQATSVKQLRRRNGPLLLKNTKPPHVIEVSRQIPFYLYVQKAKDPPRVLDDIRRYYVEHRVPIADQLDFIVIHDVGLVTQVKHPELSLWAEHFSEQERTGWFFEQWGPRTLAGLLLSMDSVFHSRALVQARVLGPYLKGLSRKIVRLGELTQT